MVFFNCNACGEALKKNQVEKHLFRCRQCEALSCVDCGKDFWGNDYQTHTKCMTEDEKYCGKGYVPKVNKGEVKQEQWTEKVQSAIERSASNPKLSGLLERLKDYPNIPRKKPKFENFLKNSLRIGSQPLITQVWETLMAATEQVNKQNEPGKTEKQVNDNGLVESDMNAATVEKQNDKQETNDLENTDKKMSKREKKEQRQKKKQKKEKKDKSSENGVQEGEKEQKKGKKRKHSVDNEEENNNTPSEESSPGKKKKKKSKHDEEDMSENGVADVNGNAVKSDSETEVEVSKKKKKKTKFNWEATITAVLKSKGEMSLKKLRKKVLNEFAAQDAANYAEENLSAKFDKKVKRLSTVKVFKDRAKLK